MLRRAVLYCELVVGQMQDTLCLAAFYFIQKRSRCAIYRQKMRKLAKAHKELILAKAAAEQQTSQYRNQVCLSISPCEYITANACFGGSGCACLCKVFTKCI